MKAAAESSRLRILLLLARGDLTVTDLTEILAQSQPRVSRHLKLLMEAGLIERYQEGSWAFFRLSDNDAGDILPGVIGRIDRADPTVERDLEPPTISAPMRRAGTSCARSTRPTARLRRR
jgi:ArsR family transcriptional regulator